MKFGINRRLGAGLAALALGVGGGLAVGCGDDGSDSDSESESGTEESGPDLAAIETYLTDHSAELLEQVTILQEKGQEYYDLAESHDFDYEAMMKEDGDTVEGIILDSQEAFEAANPAYEEAEGIVAGVPRLAQYDVDIDAGSDASDPESAVSFSLELPDGETLEQPGNLFFVTETSLYGTNPDFLADVPQDLNGDGKEETGEGVPDANIYLGAVNEFLSQAESLDADANEFEATESDAFTAITVMTPTMAEYFEAWKNSEFIAGEKASELGFVATSRLSDIADILEGIVFVYDEIEPTIAEESPEQAEQTGQELQDLLAFVEDLRDREEQGEDFSAEDADTLGTQAQKQAEAIAGQVTQAAEQSGIEIQDA
ncbi:MAG TPA: hypothetical protein VD766_04055 [Solirubrobacterales bacterium]|nr:hypothetical protein [Solirubrobacterales bacterium]